MCADYNLTAKKSHLVYAIAYGEHATYRKLSAQARARWPKVNAAAQIDIYGLA